MKRIPKIEFNKNNFYLNEDDFQSLNSKGFGKRIEKLFILNNYEVLYLLEKNKIEVFSIKGKELNFEEIIKKTKTDFKKYIVYKNLVFNGYKVATAIKFGADFRVYEKDKTKKEHSKYLVNVFDEKDKLKISQLSAKCRIAHTTKKNYLIAIVDTDYDVVYFDTSWKKL